MGQLEQMFSQPDYSKMGFFEKLTHTWPARTLQELFSAAKLPGEVYAGQRQVFDPQTGHVSQDVIQRSADLAGGVTLGAGALPAQKNSLRMGIKAYHGSPHDFDKFSMDKIGTGEGAQAYGHGLYFAENEGVARSYRDALTQNRVAAANRQLDKFGGDIAQAKQAAMGEIDRLKSLPNAGGDAARRDRFIALQEEKLAELNALEQSGKMSSGSMYEVDINANPDDFLDWDAPLNAQPKKVREYIDQALSQDDVYQAWKKNGAIDKIKTNLLYDRLSGPQGMARGNTQGRTAASDAAREAGIPGIKYKDAGSRGLDGDSGSRNYVVFDDKLISIVKKYGIAGAIGMGLMTQEQGKAYAAQAQAQQQNDSLGDILANALKGRL